MLAERCGNEVGEPPPAASLCVLNKLDCWGLGGTGGPGLLATGFFEGVGIIVVNVVVAITITVHSVAPLASITLSVSVQLMLCSLAGYVVRSVGRSVCRPSQLGLPWLVLVVAGGLSSCCSRLGVFVVVVTAK